MSDLGDIFGALIGKESNRKAVNTQADSVRETNAQQLAMFNQVRADNAPLLEARNDALSQIKNLLANPSGVANQPDYKFGFDQGTRGINSGAASRGMTYSGAAGKALTRFGQDYAGTKLDASYNRLSNLAGLGQVGANNNMTAGMNYANQTGDNTIGMGNAQVAAGLSTSRGWRNAINATSAYGDRNGWFGGNALQSGGNALQSGGGYGSVSGGYVSPEGLMFNNPSAFIIPG